MDARFAAHHHCTLGGAGFQSADYSVKEEPIVEAGKGVTGRTITVDGFGWVEDSDPSAFAAAVLAATAALRVDGQDFAVYGLGGALEYALLAAVCVDGGPHVSLEILPQIAGAAMVKSFRYTVKASTKANPASSDPDVTWKKKVATKPDGLVVVTFTGDVKGPGARAWIEGRVIPALGGAFAGAFWVPAVEFEVNRTDDAGTFTLTYTQLNAALPAAGGATAVQGEVTESFEVDEQYEVTRTIAYDLVVRGGGDPMKLRDLIRARLAAPPIRERYAVVVHNELRIQGEVSVLESGSGDDLIFWVRSLEAQEMSPNTLESYAVPGLPPILIKKPLVNPQYIDTGRAIGRTKYPKAPAPLMPFFAATGRVKPTRLSDFRFQIEWTYTYITENGVEVNDALLRKLERPQPS